MKIVIGVFCISCQIAAASLESAGARCRDMTAGISPTCSRADTRRELEEDGGLLKLRIGEEPVSKLAQPHRVFPR